MKRTTKRKTLKRTTKPTKQKALVKELDTRVYSLEELEDTLPVRQKRFCHLYIRQYNAVRSYMEAFNKNESSYSAAGCSSSNLLKKNKIKQYITYIEKDIAKEVGMSKIDFLIDLKRIAKAKLPDMYDDWITRKELSKLKRLYPELTIAIQEISTKVVVKQDPLTFEPYTVEYVQVKLKDGLRATDMIFRAMGWNAAEKIEQETKVNVDISKYTDEEKSLLLKMARKNEFLEG